MRNQVMTGLVALGCLAGPVLAQDMPMFGGEEDQAYAGQIWTAMEEMHLAGEGMIMSFPYPGTDPHGMMLETFYTMATIDGHSGALVVKRNYGPEGVSVDEVLGAPAEHLGALTIMFQREAGYDDETGNWFYAKYLPDGALDQNPDGVALAGLVGKNADAGCIACHQNAGGDDYLFTTDAEMGMGMAME
ncbi:cytochrome P460 family protein [Limimaricola pyoseonensis]|uniref:Cytochrome P460 n=1 Tax=Limimaricola pyoseonensis TaxID=521013 RepID=A0A1G7I6B2_9RHOB|nr:cytochrome P460 family protein [Limimaricola pyoseonensis]SDF08270.1 Cytochrome P460 [Limimaricola pyoseonensis]